MNACRVRKNPSRFCLNRSSGYFQPNEGWTKLHLIDKKPLERIKLALKNSGIN